MATSRSTSASTDVDGLSIVADFVTLDEERELVRRIGRSLSRASPDERNRIERYGNGVVASGYSGGTRFDLTIPAHLAELCDRMVGRKLLAARPDALSVNEYLVGQSLCLHADNDCTGSEIATLALLGAATMVFRYAKEPPILVPHAPRSLLIMRPPCRYWPWQHAVVPVLEDRISIVFRCAIQPTQ